MCYFSVVWKGLHGTISLWLKPLCISHTHDTSPAITVLATRGHQTLDIVEQLGWLQSKLTISTSSTRSCLRHLRDTRCSLTSCRVSFLTMVLRHITTSTLTHIRHHVTHWFLLKDFKHHRVSRNFSVVWFFWNFCLLLLDVGTQLENIFLAGCLEFVGETKIFNLNLERVERRGPHSAMNPSD